MNETQVVRAAYALCKALNKNGAEMLGKEIADVINKHSIGAAAAGLGVAWLPGAGSTAALAACAGVIWSMYFRINSRIGVSLSKNILKSVGTAIATNLAASVVSSVAISTVASLFPGIGNVAASAVMAGVSYSLTWASGLIYLKVLARLAGRNSDLSSVDEETLKRTAKDIMANEDIKSVLKEAKAQYKSSKERGEINKGATVDEESENQAILVDEDGLYFIENEIQVGWDDVVEISDQSSDGVAYYQFELRGGLIVATGWIAGDISEYMDAPTCTDEDVADLDPDDTSDENLDALRAGIANLFWARDLANEIREAAHLVINEIYLLNRIVEGERKVCCFIGDSDSEDTDRVYDALGAIEIEGKYFENWGEAIRNQVKNLSEDDVDVEGTEGLIAFSFYLSCGLPSCETGKGIKHQKEVYDALRSARSWGKDDVEDDVKTILTSSEDDDVPIGDDKWVKTRKMIVCTDARSALCAIDGGVKIANVMVMSAEDIENYNESEVGNQFPLVFDIGHPKNGQTYLQHPLQQNRYVDVDDYDFVMLTSKWLELQRLLEHLGATKMTSKVSSAKMIEEKSRRKQDVSGRVDIAAVGGVSCKTSHERGDSSLADLFQEMSGTIELHPSDKPSIPDGLVFFKAEPGWQQMAESVLAGRMTHACVDLVYKTETVVSSRQMRSIEAELSSAVPGYQFGIGGSFADEFEKERRERKSLIWHYEVMFGDQNRKPTEKTDVKLLSLKEKQKRTKAKRVTGNDGEALLLKFAKQYAKSDAAKKNGGILGGQREDLERKARRYGIDEARLDEIILKAIS